MVEKDHFCFVQAVRMFLYRLFYGLNWGRLSRLVQDEIFRLG